MKQIRFLTILLVVLLMAVCFSACNNETAEAIDAALLKADQFANKSSQLSTDIVIKVNQHETKIAFDAWIKNGEAIAAELLATFSIPEDMQEIQTIAADLFTTVSELIKEGQAIDTSLLSENDRQALTDALISLDEALTSLETVITAGV